jgi:hypothetical protein
LGNRASVFLLSSSGRLENKSVLQFSLFCSGFLGHLEQSQTEKAAENEEVDNFLLHSYLS